MSTIQTKDFDTLVRDEVTAVQGQSSSLVDLTIGSILRAVMEAFAGVVLWLQGIALQVASLTRFSTSSGSDADSWGADFGFTRLPATAATGAVTFARFTATNEAQIPIGTIVETADGTQTYAVVADTTQSAYNSTLGAYVIAAGTTSCTASVQAVTAGVAANASAGSISIMSSAISYVDTVTNALDFTNGADAETDSAYRTRFVEWVASLSKATPAAVGNAITNVQTGLFYSITENQLYNGTTQLGYFYVVVDDGTGSPSSTLLATVAAAVDTVRPVGSDFGVFAPVVETASVSMTITTASGYTHSSILATISSALSSYINSLGLGETLYISRLVQIAYDASDGVTNVSGVTLNSGTSDLTATAKQVVRAGTISLT